MQRVDWDDLAQAIEDGPEGLATRLEVELAFPWVAEVRDALRLPEEAAFRLSPPLDHRYLNTLIDVDPPNPNSTPLRYEPIEPRGAPDFEADPFGALDERDTALYHPLDDYGIVERFVERAAVNPEVDRIRISLYRLGARNPIAEALMKAARAGKDVAVLLEGRARFDELQNLHWSLLFRAAGIRILPLPLGYKVHAKALYVRRAGRGYVHLCTGNYNPTNERLYTDLTLFSSNPALASDAIEFFDALEAGGPPPLERMRYGIDARDTMLDRIRREAHPGGHVILKMNHLTDPAVFEALGEAADAGAGAGVDVIARSTLTLHDGRFTMRRVVGRFSNTRAARRSVPAGSGRSGPAAPTGCPATSRSASISSSRCSIPTSRSASWTCCWDSWPTTSTPSPCSRTAATRLAGAAKSTRSWRPCSSPRGSSPDVHSARPPSGAWMRSRSRSRGGRFATAGPCTAASRTLHAGTPVCARDRCCGAPVRGTLAS